MGDPVVTEIVAFLLSVERFREQDVFNKHQLTPERAMRLAMWRAREIVRVEHGIDFVGVPSFPGEYVRGDCKQIADKASRRRRAGTRILIRSAERLELAASMSGVEAYGRSAARLREHIVGDRLRKSRVVKP